MADSLTPQPYQYQIRDGARTAPAKVVGFVGKNLKVLEVGAGPGSIARHLAEVGDCEVHAIEIHSASAAKLRTFCKAVYEADLDAPNWTDCLNGERFDVVIAADVLEHLKAPQATLNQLKTLLKPGGRFIASIPNVGYNGLIACLYLGDFRYSEVGLLDKTHIKFFGVRNVESMLSEAGLALTHADTVVIAPAKSEFSRQWASIPDGLKTGLAGNPFGSVYQFVVVTQDAAEVNQPISLDQFAASGAEIASWRAAADNYAPSLRSRVAAALKARLTEGQLGFLRELAWRMRLTR